MKGTGAHPTFSSFQVCSIEVFFSHFADLHMIF
jgi:hypothetical protein